MLDLVHDTEHPIIIHSHDLSLDGLLHIPQQAQGIVIFAHGSGSSRFSPRNQFIARILQEARMATLLFDLLTLEEDEIDAKTMEYRFDVELLANRLLSATSWVATQP